MPYHTPGDAEITSVLTAATTIAMVGASSNPERESHGIMRKLQSVGYRVIPVNPRETEVLGERSYPSLLDIPERVDIVDVFRRPEDTPAIADEAVTIGAKALWLQTGIVSEEAAARATAGGLMVVMDACIGATHALLRVPKGRPPPAPPPARPRSSPDSARRGARTFPSLQSRFRWPGRLTRSSRLSGGSVASESPRAPLPICAAVARACRADRRRREPVPAG